MKAIVIDRATKDYGNGKGVFDLSLAIDKGEVFGFLGPNGAGKTTTIRQLLGFTHPNSGSLFIDGKRCFDESAKINETLGYLPGEIAFFDDMTGKEFLRFMASMRGLRDMTKTHTLTDFFELDIKGKIKKMSKGTKQKVGLVCAFMHDPEVLILDEPTDGLDPLMQSKFIGLVLKQKAFGKTIFMSSHSFDEIDRTCDRVAIIRAGRLAAVEQVSEIKASSIKRYQIAFEKAEEAAGFLKMDFSSTPISNTIISVAISGDINPLIHTLSTLQVTGLSEISMGLEEVFMQYYGKADVTKGAVK